MAEKLIAYHTFIRGVFQPCSSLGFERRDSQSSQYDSTDCQNKGCFVRADCSRSRRTTKQFLMIRNVFFRYCSWLWKKLSSRKILVAKLKPKHSAVGLAARAREIRA